jgi:uncharacterized membrane protein AbrB (regulator of aidB expression)
MISACAVRAGQTLALVTAFQVCRQVSVLVLVEPLYRWPERR